MIEKWLVAPRWQHVVTIALALVMAGTLVEPVEATDRYFFGGLFNWSDRKPTIRQYRKKPIVRRTRRKKKVRPNRTRPSKQEIAAARETFSTAPDGPVQVVVSLPEQYVRVYQNGAEIGGSIVSTGKPGYDTPAGVFTILQKRRWHNSNLYSNAPMPYMQRITWSGVALHEGEVPDYPASHGCIRLPRSFARALFGLTRRGAQVVVANDDVAPRHIDHAKLVQPVSEPAAQALVQSIDSLEDLAALTDRIERLENRSKAPVRILITRQKGHNQVADIQLALAKLGYEPGPADGFRGPMTNRAIRKFQADNGLPINGRIDEEFEFALFDSAGIDAQWAGHLYVRQGFKEVFDTPITIRDIDQPLGTHLYTALHFTAANDRAQWTAMTLKTDDWIQPIYENEGSGGIANAAAGEALDRIEIPAAIRQRLADMLTPGSSLVITDRGFGKEKVAGTDFIVVTHNDS